MRASPLWRQLKPFARSRLCLARDDSTRATGFVEGSEFMPQGYPFTAAMRVLCERNDRTRRGKPGFSLASMGGSRCSFKRHSSGTGSARSWLSNLHVSSIRNQENLEGRWLLERSYRRCDLPGARWLAWDQRAGRNTRPLPGCSISWAGSPAVTGSGFSSMIECCAAARRRFLLAASFALPGARTLRFRVGTAFALTVLVIAGGGDDATLVLIGSASPAPLLFLGSSGAD